MRYFVSRPEQSAYFAPTEAEDYLADPWPAFVTNGTRLPAGPPLAVQPVADFVLDLRDFPE